MTGSKQGVNMVKFQCHKDLTRCHEGDDQGGKAGAKQVKGNDGCSGE